MTVIWHPMLSEFSVFTAFLFFIAFTIVCYCLFRKAGWYMLWAIALGLVLTVVRCLFPVEIPGTNNIRLPGFFSDFFRWCKTPIWGNILPYQIFLWFWMIGAALGLVLLVVNFLSCVFIVAKEDFLPGRRMNTLYEEVCQELRCRKKRALFMSSNIVVPYSIGYFRPNVLFPRIMENCPDEQVRLAIKHEILHYMHHDLWVAMAARILCCLLWWNPAVYLLYFIIDYVSELRCDCRVCKGLDRRQILNYYEVLLFATKIQNMYKDKRKKKKAFHIGFTGRLKEKENAEKTEENKTNKRFNQIIKASRGELKQSKTSVVVAVIICMLFLGSYTVTFQTGGFPSEDEVGIVTYNFEDDSNYIMRYPDGTLELFIDHQKHGSLNSKDLEKEPFSSMLIVDVY